ICLLVCSGVVFLDMKTVTDLTSIGTLFAFVLVCAGVLRLRSLPDAPQSKFKTPYINSRFIVPALFVLACVLISIYNAPSAKDFFSSREFIGTEQVAETLAKNQAIDKEIRTALSEEIKLAPEVFDTTSTSSLLGQLSETQYRDFALGLPENSEARKAMVHSGMSVLAENIPMWLFVIVSIWIVVSCVRMKHSLIPVLGLVSCLYMMVQVPFVSWIGFSIWLIIGLCIYFGYGRKNSRLGLMQKENANV
ncbi:MAG: amino acid permease C-terminal domain-containing protein, partial [Bacteroidia bacterium]